MAIRKRQAITFAVLTLPLLLGMEGGGCADSTAPLSAREDGFVDPYLLGDWYEFEDDETSKTDDESINLDTFGPGEHAYRIFVAGPGEMRVQNFREGRLFEEFAAWSSLLRGDKYLNLLRLDCPGCSEEERQQRADNVCPYRVVRYRTYIPQSWIETAREDLEGEDISETELQAFFARLHGNSVAVVAMDGGEVRSAMRAGEIDGFEYCEECKSRQVCVDVESASLARFVLENRDGLFDPDPWVGEIYLRAEAAVKKRETAPLPAAPEEPTPTQ